jgi:hypothetical protein
LEFLLKTRDESDVQFAELPAKEFIEWVNFQYTIIEKTQEIYAKLKRGIDAIVMQ